MYLKFSNKRGDLVFGGSERSNSGIYLTAMEGFLNPDRDFTTAKYSNFRGQETLGVHICPRTITLSGDVLETGDNQNLMSEAAYILDIEGVLEVHFENKSTRAIKCRCQSFVPGEKIGKYTLFVVQFICDDPYFYEPEMKVVTTFGRKALLDNDFTFPGIFSSRVSRSILNCEGNAYTEPIFKILVMEKNDEVSPEIKITNHTTGSHIKLIYNANVGDIITIDTEKRKIYNQDGENLLRFLSDDTFFDDFYLVAGENDIEFTISENVDSVRAQCEYYARYIEAVI